ncbi:uncharacterized protein PRCAT00003810001 [Priceomyces carsonii]|uniref:uncharacterized protein n=1 Tax=Priceomyces carsonii TaxID=28549 RepID=UPI002EDB5891|nr:unnamed protein product [Priceomyces carsonii]
MKFAKVLEKTLMEEDVPEDWLEAAIQYKALKKCINKVVSELEFLGLEHNTLKLILEDSDKHEIKEIDEQETTASNPIIAEYTLTKSNGKKSEHIVPMLKILLDYSNADYSDDHIYEQGLELKRRIEGLLYRGSDSDDDNMNGQRLIEVKEDEDEALVISPQTSWPQSPVIKEEVREVIDNDHKDTSDESPKSKKRVNEIYIMLNSDVKFFQMLDDELEGLDQLKAAEEAKLIQEVEKLRGMVQEFADPKRRKDLYTWRELFKIYLDSEVYFKYNETSSPAFERSIDQVKENMQHFIDNVNKSNVLTQFRSKKGILTYDQFLSLNYHLFKVLQFQSINLTALRKILKKFDKQTALGVQNQFPRLVSADHVFITGKSLAQSICYVLQSSVVELVPQIDDYICPICCSIAFKPIRLECGHVFCVRCLVKLKQQQKTSCPFCRAEHVIENADGRNLDLETMEKMKKFFPIEVKEKLKERDKEKYEDLIGNGKCTIM